MPTVMTADNGDPVEIPSALVLQAYVKSMADFVLAQLLHPEHAAAVAARVLIPGPEVPRKRGDSRPTADWMTIRAMVEWCGHKVQHSLIYEVYVEQLLGWNGFGRTTTAWPTIWLEALRVYCVQAFGVDCTDADQLAALEREAYEAKREAYEAMYGTDEE